VSSILRSTGARAQLAVLFIVAVASQLPAQSLPSPQQLAARHDSASGGRAALDAHRSVHLVGTFSLPAMGIESPLEILKVRPNHYLFRTSLGPMGEMLSGFDGKNAWAVQPGQGPVVMSGEQASLLAEQADFYASFKDLARYVSAETVMETDFEGSRAYQVKLTRANGDVIMEYYDVASGLSLGGVAAVETPMGRIESTTVLGAYRTFGSVRLATRIVQRNPQFEVVLAVKDVKFDTLDEAAVSPPEAVKALIKP
jgi:hypothetical protein